MGALGDGERAPFSVRAVAVTAAAAPSPIFPTVVGLCPTTTLVTHGGVARSEPTMAGHALAAGSLAGRERISAAERRQRG